MICHCKKLFESNAGSVTKGAISDIYYIVISKLHTPDTCYIKGCLFLYTVNSAVSIIPCTYSPDVDYATKFYCNQSKFVEVVCTINFITEQPINQWQSDSSVYPYQSMSTGGRAVIKMHDLILPGLPLSYFPYFLSKGTQPQVQLCMVAVPTTFVTHQNWYPRVPQQLLCYIPNTEYMSLCSHPAYRSEVIWICIDKTYLWIQCL